MSQTNTEKPAILVLCTSNSCRSQMAEALLRKHVGDRFEVHSAGLEPKDIHPLTFRAIEEVGLDLAGHRPKGVGEFLGKLPVRCLIIVCDSAARSRPSVWPGLVERLLWPFEDSASFERGTPAICRPADAPCNAGMMGRYCPLGTSTRTC